MEKKDYVSYDVAMSLKEKGYSYGSTRFTVDKETCETLDTPTLYDAQKWLREKHLLHIDVGMANDYSEDADGNVVDSWDFWCYNIYYTTNFSHHLVNCEGEFESYEAALDEGIKRALEYI